jgi:hypothetical protein
MHIVPNIKLTVILKRCTCVLCSSMTPTTTSTLSCAPFPMPWRSLACKTPSPSKMRREKSSNSASTTTTTPAGPTSNYRPLHPYTHNFSRLIDSHTLLSRTKVLGSMNPLLHLDSQTSTLSLPGITLDNKLYVRRPFRRESRVVCCSSSTSFSRLSAFCVPAVYMQWIS